MRKINKSNEIIFKDIENFFKIKEYLKGFKIFKEKFFLKGYSLLKLLNFKDKKNFLKKLNNLFGVKIN